MGVHPPLPSATREKIQLYNANEYKPLSDNAIKIS